MKRLTVTVYFALLGLICSAASATPDSLSRIVGMVYQEKYLPTSSGFRPSVEGCLVQLFYEKEGKLDSLYTLTPQSGRFSFKNIPPQRVVLKLQCLGYETKSAAFDIGPGENAFFFTMKESVSEIAAARVSSEVPLMKQIKDTTIFNTQAIRSLPGEGLKDVLSQIPGFNVTESGVSFDGIKINRTYVNGVLVFGDDPMNAVNALMADEVTQVKVYDEQSAVDRRRGKINSRKERVLDVRTRQNFLSLSRATAAAAAGIDGDGRGRYGVGAGANYDAEMLNMEAAVYADNYSTYSSLISSASAIQSYIQPGNNPLTSDIKKEGLNFEIIKHWKSRSYGNNILVEYRYLHKDESEGSLTRTDYFGNGDQLPQTSTESFSSNFSQLKHYIAIIGRMMDTPLKSLEFSLGATVTNNSNDASNIDIWQTDDLVTKNRNEDNGSRDKSYNIRGHIGWTNNDAVKWRPRIKVEGNFMKNNEVYWIVDTLESSFTQRHLSSDGTGNSISGELEAGLSHNILNDKKRTMDIDICGNMLHLRRDNRNIALNRWKMEVPVMDLANSFDYTASETESKAAVTVIYSNTKKLNLTAEAGVSYKVLQDKESIPRVMDDCGRFFFPYYTVNFSIPKVQVESSCQSITPALEQVRARVSDTNPMVLKAGNPNLKKSDILKINCYYNSGAISGKGRSTRTTRYYLDGEMTTSPIVARSVLFTEDTRLDNWDGYEAKAGSMLYTWENSKSPAWKIASGAQYDTRIFRNKVGSVFGIDASYSRNPMYLGGDIVRMETFNGSIRARVMYSPTMRISLHSNTTLGYVHSMERTWVLSSRMNLSESFSIKWFILSRLRLEGRYNILSNNYIQGYGKDNITQFLSLNLTKAFFKDASLEVSLSGNDLLNSQSSYQTQTNALYMTQSWRRTYGPYYILSITYKFRKKR